MNKRNNEKRTKSPFSLVYFYSKKKNTLKLYEYAKKMNIYNKVQDIFEVLK